MLRWPDVDLCLADPGFDTDLYVTTDVRTFLELGPEDVNLTRNETGGVTETVVTFLLPVGAPVTVDAPAPRHCPL